MNKYVFGSLERISKKKAMNIYIGGGYVYILPCKANPRSSWYEYPYIINRKSREEFVIDETGVKNDFYNTVSNFEYYNCNAETGRYAAFYIEK